MTEEELRAFVEEQHRLVNNVREWGGRAAKPREEKKLDIESFL